MLQNLKTILSIEHVYDYRNFLLFAKTKQKTHFLTNKRIKEMEQTNQLSLSRTIQNV